VTRLLSDRVELENCITFVRLTDSFLHNDLMIQWRLKVNKTLDGKITSA